jgi:hypothetical protein
MKPLVNISVAKSVQPLRTTPATCGWLLDNRDFPFQHGAFWKSKKLWNMCSSPSKPRQTHLRIWPRVYNLSRLLWKTGIPPCPRYSYILSNIFGSMADFMEYHHFPFLKGLMCLSGNGITQTHQFIIICLHLEGTSHFHPFSETPMYHVEQMGPLLPTFLHFI